ncbi:MAG: OmpP1/FadL family transporter [Vulcanimicrobiaceae bacterium]
MKNSNVGTAHRLGPARIIAVSCMLVLLTALPAQATTNGHILIGVGAVNQSMGGAGIATSLDAIGSCYGNAGSISFVRSSSAEFAMDLFTPHRTMFASIPGAAAGSVTSRTEQAVIPGMSFLDKPRNSRFSYALCALGIAGMGVSYPAVMPSAGGHFNPLAVPQSFGGFGAIYSNLQFLQVTPTVAYMLSPRLSLGLGLDSDWQSLQVSPFAATPPNASGYPVSSPASSSFGSGFTVGLAWRPEENLELGVVYKSPQHMQTMEFTSQYPDGTPATFGFRLDYPMIAGAGIAYQLTPKLLVAADEHWIDYANTRGFSQSGFAPDGAVRGFGWRSIYATAVGFQYSVNGRLAVRAGYNHSGNPVPPSQQFFNVFAPALIQNSVTAGLGYKVDGARTIDVVYLHGFSNAVSGPVYMANNAVIPNSVVRNRLSENELSLQFRFKI